MLKVTIKNTSAIASKGTTRSEGSSYVNVADTIVFPFNHFCSPDGRSHSYGCDIITANFLYAEDLVLEKYDNTHVNSYGSGSYDTATITEIAPSWKHNHYTSVYSKTYLMCISDSSDSILPESKNRIEPLKNGKFLHIYLLTDQQEVDIKEATSFEEAIKSIQNSYTERVWKYENWQGQELDYTETRSGWYKPSQAFGYWSATRQHEYDSTRTYHRKIRLSENCPEGSFNCYLNGSPVLLTLKQGQVPRVALHYNGSGQNWSLDHLRETDLPKGVVFQDGQDVWELTQKHIGETLAAERALRQEKTDKAISALAQKGWTEKKVNQLISTAKGRVLVTLQAALAPSSYCTPQIIVDHSRSLISNDPRKVREHFSQLIP